MKKILSILVAIISLSLNAQTVLISPTVNNGGFEDGSNAPWSVLNGTQINKWQISTNADAVFSGNKSAYISNSNSAPFTYNYNLNSSSATFIYQDVVFPAGETVINLTFKVKVQGENSGFLSDYVRVFLVDPSVSLFPGMVLDPDTHTANWTYTMLGSSWTTQNISISAAQAGNSTSASTKRLVFQWKNDNNFGNQPPAAIDDIQLTSSSCGGVVPLEASNITQNSAQANWNALAGATAYILEYRPAASSAWNTINVGNISSYSLSGLMPDTNYEYRIAAVGTSCSIFSTIISFKTGYCNAGSSTQLSWLKTFSTSGALANMNFNSATLTSSPSGYKDESSNHSVSHYPGSTVNIMLSAGGSPAGFAIWIDWNQNYIFESNERVFVTSAYLGNATGNVTVPAGTSIGSYRMRLVADTNNPSPSISCGNIVSGEIVDFTFNVVAAPTCYPPTNVTVNNITGNSAEVTFTAPSAGAPALYEYYVSTSNVAPVISTVATGSTVSSPLVISQLQPATTYYVWLRSNCGSTDISAWSLPAQFTTTCGVFQVPYSQNFESSTGGFPICTSSQNAGSGNTWNVANVNTNGFSSKALIYYYDTADAGNAWFFTPQIALEAGKRYAITYKYGNDGDPSLPERLKVAYGNSPNAAAMVNLLKDHPNVVTTGPQTERITFTPAVPGNYNFGFNAYSAADMNVLMVDDIVIESNAVIWDGTQWSNTIGPDATTDAEIAGNYMGGPITSKFLTINSGVNVVMNGALNAANINNLGHLIIGQEGTMLYTGTYTSGSSATFKVQKDVTAVSGNQYSFWSSPVASQSMFGIFDSGTPQFVTDYNTAGNTWVAVASPANALNGKGYSVKTPAGATTATFTGTPNNGDFTTVISAPNPDPEDNYVLLGNPYPSLFSLQAFSTANPANLKGNFWLWDKGGQSYGTYNAPSDTYTPAPGSTIVLNNGNIHPAQGFLAEAVSGATSVLFDNNMRFTGSTGYMNKKSPSGKEGKIWVKLQASAKEFTTAALTYGYGENGFDKADAKSLSNPANDLFTIVGNERVIIQGKGAFIQDDVVPVGMKFAADAKYTVSLTKSEGIFTDSQEVVLHDKSENIFHNLSTSAYTFLAEKGENENRFEILFRKISEPVSHTTVNISRNGEVFTVTSPEPIRYVEIYDASGRLVQKVTGGTTSLDLNVTAKGVYLVNIVTVKEVVSRKIIN